MATPRRDTGRDAAMPSVNPCSRCARGFLAFLQGAFEKGAPGFRWSEDIGTSDLYIAEGQVKDPTQLPKLPAIMVTHDDVRWVLPCQSKKFTRRGEYTTTSNQITFRIIVQVVHNNADVANDLGWAIFALLPQFTDILEQNSSISLHGNPVMQPAEIKGKDDVLYPSVLLQVQGAVFVSVTRNWTKSDGVFDNAVKRATMVLELDAPQEATVRGVSTVDMRHHPQSMTDLVIVRGPDGRRRVLAPERQPSTEGPIEKETDIDITGRENDGY